MSLFPAIRVGHGRWEGSIANAEDGVGDAAVRSKADGVDRFVQVRRIRKNCRRDVLASGYRRKAHVLHEEMAVSGLVSGGRRIPHSRRDLGKLLTEQ
jgi:hypothetical protein